VPNVAEIIKDHVAASTTRTSSRNTGRAQPPRTTARRRCIERMSGSVREVARFH